MKNINLDQATVLLRKVAFVVIPIGVVLCIALFSASLRDNAGGTQKTEEGITLPLQETVYLATNANDDLEEEPQTVAVTTTPSQHPSAGQKLFPNGLVIDGIRLSSQQVENIAEVVMISAHSTFRTTDSVGLSYEDPLAGFAMAGVFGSKSNFELSPPLGDGDLQSTGPFQFNGAFLEAHINLHGDDMSIWACLDTLGRAYRNTDGFARQNNLGNHTNAREMVEETRDNLFGQGESESVVVGELAFILETHLLRGSGGERARELAMAIHGQANMLVFDRNYLGGW